MPKEYERGAWDMARRAAPNFLWDYRGKSPEDAGQSYDPKHGCRICGGVMHFHDMQGNVARYACNGFGCANNPDSDWKQKFSFETLPEIGNPDLIWHTPQPIC